MWVRMGMKMEMGDVLCAAIGGLASNRPSTPNRTDEGGACIPIDDRKHSGGTHYREGRDEASTGSFGHSAGTSVGAEGAVAQ